VVGLPPTWAVILAIVSLFFGGTGGIIWSLRRERREAKLAPAEAEARKLQNERTSAEIAEMLRDAQKEAIADMKALLNEARLETQAARDESRTLRVETEAARREARDLRVMLEEIRQSQVIFRGRVEDLLTAHRIAIPDWWHN
jgi:hypothetical protein